ncbi:adenine deaminase [Chloroflexota bacterium]
MADLAKFIAVARGDLRADLLFTNARVVNVFSGEIESTNVAVYGGMIAGLGDYKIGKQIFNLDGEYIVPGFIDGHTHLESSMLHIAEYARAVVPHGTTGVVTDLHEIANVAGLNGMKYMMEWGRRLPISFYFMVPSCVPATDLETAGASLEAADIKKALEWKGVLGLGEMMNFPGVILAVPEVLDKISAIKHNLVDGHAPGLRGMTLNSYIASGIYSDHECTTLSEAKEKLARGMHIMIREGSSEKNLETLLPLVNDRNYSRCFFVIDDRNCMDLRNDGDMDAVVRKAVTLGMDAVRAIQLATINPARYFGLEHVGGIAPGYSADIVVVNDLKELRVDMVFYRGKIVARNGKAIFQVPLHKKEGMLDTFRVKPLYYNSFVLSAEKKSRPVIEVVPGQIITKKVKARVKIEKDIIIADTETDILKAAVVERHMGTGNVGVAMVKGFGLKKGAIGSSVSHDSHNIVVVGTNDTDMIAVVNEISRLQGGLAVASGGKIEASLPLPVAGLLSLEPLEEVVRQFEVLEVKVKEMGCSLPSPFATLSFLALPVIPELRLTDRGLVDVKSFKIID